MKTYLSEVKKYYNFIFLCKYAILLTSALFIIDIFNFPTNILFSYNIKVTIIFLGLFILFILLTAIELHLHDVMKIVSINIIDSISLIILLSSILFGGISLLGSTLNAYKIVTLIIIIIIVTALIVVRSIRIKKSMEKVEMYQSNVVDLKDIYDGNFSIKQGKPLMVSEKEVDYNMIYLIEVVLLIYYMILLRTVILMKVSLLV